MVIPINLKNGISSFMYVRCKTNISSAAWVGYRKTTHSGKKFFIGFLFKMKSFIGWLSKAKRYPRYKLKNISPDYCRALLIGFIINPKRLSLL